MLTLSSAKRQQRFHRHETASNGRKQAVHDVNNGSNGIDLPSKYTEQRTERDTLHNFGRKLYVVLNLHFNLQVVKI
ncbi:hypothetical protein H5410_011008 [Solanum commersonii]|uniref:Uncharacterized protein n=1 Tax=Solanum commersonii TaxID=4109 RepID=A0A9J6AMF9_SOLCO|nr:hypothetical protein H5410_011008 [Solanum commersonii]